MKSEFAKLSPLNILSDKKDENGIPIYNRMPSPRLFENIKILWGILDLIEEDWRSLKKPYEDKYKEFSGMKDEWYHAKIIPLFHFQVPFLKCLFSYIQFYIILYRVYVKIFKELDFIYNLLEEKNLQKPEESKLCKKISNIRNKAIVHFGIAFNANEEEIKNQINNIAGMNWMVTMNCLPDFNLDKELVFGSFSLSVETISEKKISQNMDLQITFGEILNKGKSELIEFDRLCAESLGGLYSILPKSDYHGPAITSA